MTPIGLCNAGGIRFVSRGGAGDGLRACGIGPAGAQQLSRGRSGRGLNVPRYSDARSGIPAEPLSRAALTPPARFGGLDASTILDQSLWQSCYDQDAWQAILTALSRDEAQEKRFRDSTRTGRPLGDESFLAQLESTYPHIRPNKRGPKPKPATHTATAQE